MTYKNSAVLALVLLGTAVLAGQDRLKMMPGYDAAQRMARDAPSAVTGAITGVVWIDQGLAFEYERDGKRYRNDVASGNTSNAEASTGGDSGRGARGRGSNMPGPARGRQADSTLSPDRTLKAFYRDRNVWISSA